MVEDIGDLAGLSRTNPVMAFMLAMILFSLAGIPPLAGFFAKFYVFLAAIEAGLYVLAVIGVLASVVGAYYYLRIVKIMYFDEPARALRADARPNSGSCSACQRRLHPVLRPHRRPGRQRRRRRRQDVLLSAMADAIGAPRRLPAGRPSTDVGSTNAEAFAGAARRRCRAASGCAGRADGGPRPARPGLGDARAGNLAASLLLIDPAPPAGSPPRISFVAGVALHRGGRSTSPVRRARERLR